MGRETSPFVVGEYWLDQRRDGRAKGIWQIARAASGSVIYKSTRTKDLEQAKGIISAFFEEQRAKGKQDATEAKVIPLMFAYWREKGRKNVNHDQTARSIRTFVAFLDQDEAGVNAVVTDMLPALFERFREWRMGPHGFHWVWGDKEGDYSTGGVSGDTVDRNLNDIRAAIGHAQDNMRIALAPKIKAVEDRHRNPFRERVLTMDELARIVWYAYHFPPLFRFVALQICTSVRPDAAKKFDPRVQYNDRTGLIDLQPDASPRTKKRNAIIPAIRPMRPVLRAWARSNFQSVDSNKTAWRNMRKALGLTDDVFPKTIRHTIATLLYADESVPEREVQAMLGHGISLHRTSQLYAKYDPSRLRHATRALTTIWRDLSKLARRYAADHRLTTGRSERGKFIPRKVEKV